MNWVGVTPTLLRDSIFSGIYYVYYTKLKSQNLVERQACVLNHSTNSERKKPRYLLNFYYGIVSGFVANPLHVIKTRTQVNQTPASSTLKAILNSPKIHLILFKGLLIRSTRRSLVASSTSSFYEFLTDKFA